MNRKLLTRTAPALAPAGLAVVAFLLLTLTRLGWLGLATATVALVAGWAASRPPALGAQLPARLVLAAGMIGYAGRATSGPGWPVAVAGAVLLGLLLAEPLLHRVARPWFTAAHLPIRPRWHARLADGGIGWLVSSAAIVTTGLPAVLSWPAWTVPLPALAAAVLAAGLAAGGLSRWRTRHRSELAELARAVEAHQPRFLLYFSAPAGSEYQVRMWLPYLERIGPPFAVVLAEQRHLPAVARATRAPVIVHRAAGALEAVIAPSLRAVFYVNNGMKNAHCVRFRQLTHVQLYHGYSDKPVSVNPINSIFDQIYVPGQAIVDQFRASGVEIPPDRFRIVGRPQAEDLTVTTRPVGEVEHPVVLYAPTWAGVHADSNHCSLPIAAPIIDRLLERGVTVIVRPHPYTSRDPGSVRRLRRVEQALAADRERTGRAHRWGRAATDLTLAECMNRSDAMICDISSLASQYLYTGKPFAVTDLVTPDASFAGSLPLARGAYLIRADAGNLPEVVDNLLVRDPHAAARRELRGYYLGDFPPDRYAEAFLAEARRCVSEPDDSTGPRRRAGYGVG